MYPIIRHAKTHHYPTSHLSVTQEGRKNAMFTPSERLLTFVICILAPAYLFLVKEDLWLHNKRDLTASPVSPTNVSCALCKNATVTSTPVALDNQTCVWIHLSNYGRSGNRLHQLEEVTEVLSRCSGVATSTSAVNRDSAVGFPPVLFGTRGSPPPFQMMESAVRVCKEAAYEWGMGKQLAKDCAASPLYDVTHPQLPGSPSSPSAPALIANVYQERAFWQRDQLAIWDTLVMYFRGGDILRPRAHPGYSQGPCSLFLEAWRVSNVSKAMLVYDPESAVNPCVEVVRETIGTASLVEPPCATVSCHMMLLGQAKYVALSGVSTFATQAFALLPSSPRVLFRYFCQNLPREDEWGLTICVQGETKHFQPWTYTDDTRTKMLEMPSQAVMGQLDSSRLDAYLRQTPM